MLSAMNQLVGRCVLFVVVVIGLPLSGALFSERVVNLCVESPIWGARFPSFMAMSIVALNGFQLVKVACPLLTLSSGVAPWRLMCRVVAYYCPFFGVAVAVTVGCQCVGLSILRGIASFTGPIPSPFLYLFCLAASSLVPVVVGTWVIRFHFLMRESLEETPIAAVR